MGGRIDVVRCYSDYEESFMVATRIAGLRHESAHDYDEYAILYRTNAQSRILEESLRKRNIPYRIYGGLSFYQRKEVKDAIAYFRLAVNPDDDEALRRVINTPARGIGETTVNKLSRAALDTNRSMWQVIGNIDTDTLGMNSGTRRRLGEFRALIQSFIDANASGMDAEQLSVRIIRDTKLLSVLLTDNTPENISKQENLQELLNGVKEYTESQRQEEGNDNPDLSAYLAQISLLTDQDVDTGDTRQVTLMTVHAAKGLEFANVFIVGLEEELFPSSMASGSPAEIEEERRLLYVAITRAKEYCMMSYATSRFRNGQTATCSPSRFLRDIDRRYLNMTTGNAIDEAPRFDPVQNYRDSFHTKFEAPHRKDAATSASRRYVDRYFTASKSAPDRETEATASAVFDKHSASELADGMVIEHERFGRGVIKQVDTSGPNARIVVEFSNLDTKTLLLHYAKFKIIE